MPAYIVRSNLSFDTPHMELIFFLSLEDYI